MFNKMFNAVVTSVTTWTGNAGKDEQGESVIGDRGVTVSLIAHTMDTGFLNDLQIGDASVKKYIEDYARGKTPFANELPLEFAQEDSLAISLGDSVKALVCELQHIHVSRIAKDGKDRSLFPVKMTFKIPNLKKQELGEIHSLHKETVQVTVTQLQSKLFNDGEGVSAANGTRKAKAKKPQGKKK